MLRHVQAPASVPLVLEVVKQLIAFVQTSVATSLGAVVKTSAEIFSSPVAKLTRQILQLSESFRAFQSVVEEKLENVFSVLHLLQPRVCF